MCGEHNIRKKLVKSSCTLETNGTFMSAILQLKKKTKQNRVGGEGGRADNFWSSETIL